MSSPDQSTAVVRLAERVAALRIALQEVWDLPAERLDEAPTIALTALHDDDKAASK